MIYKLFNDFVSNKPCSVNKNASVSIPFSPDNADYIQFKKDLQDGADLQNVDGEVMTKADITEFMRSLP